MHRGYVEPSGTKSGVTEDSESGLHSLTWMTAKVGNTRTSTASVGTALETKEANRDVLKDAAVNTRCQSRREHW
jgi:hypothetical protein